RMRRRIAPGAVLALPGTKLFRQSPRLHRGGAGSTPAVSIDFTRGRSAPAPRIKPPWCQRQARALCTAEVRVRLLPGALLTPVAQWTERCSATAAVAGSTPAGRALRT